MLGEVAVGEAVAEVGVLGTVGVADVGETVGVVVAAVGVADGVRVALGVVVGVNVGVVEGAGVDVVAGGDWIWGLVATAFAVLAVQHGLRLRVADPAPWIAFAGSVVAVWTGVLVITATGPVTVTGTDPTVIPFAAMGAPILGVFLTWFACTMVKSAFEQAA